MSDDRGSTLTPNYVYREPRAAIDFLERAFGFHAHLVVPGDDGTIAHAELRIGNDYIMVGTADDTPHATLSSYVGVADVDALYARAVAAGAAIVRPVVATAYGSREFAARDREGYPWSFGTYRPIVAGDGDETQPKLYVTLRYDAARDAIAFLCDAFGFTEHAVYPNDKHSAAIDHAQLARDTTLLMLGSDRDNELALAQPAAGAPVPGLSLYVPDPEAHCARAMRAGAEIVDAPSDTTYGARAYVARDPGGYVWHISSYRPSAVAEAT
jgi:uncharacterized glyoxalase superfamily protein PhnB